jgi:ATP-dependent RNA helicase DHX8/PRP22
MKPSKTSNIIDSNGHTITSTTQGGKLDVDVKKILCPMLAMPNQVIKAEVNLFEEEEEEEVQQEKRVESKKQVKNRPRSRSVSSARSFSSNDSDRKSSKKRKNKKKERRRSRSRSNRRHRSRTRSRNRRSRSVSSNESRRDRNKKRKSSDLPLEPVVGQIYEGTVSSIMQFGCFVQMIGLKKAWEGLVHISNLRKEGRVTLVSDVVSRHQKVKVKVISYTGTKVGLSIKDVDQRTGEDLNPQHTKRLVQTSTSTGSNEVEARNPDRPDNYSEVPVSEEDSMEKKKVKQISDFEKWELQQVSCYLFKKKT